MLPQGFVLHPDSYCILFRFNSFDTSYTMSNRNKINRTHFVAKAFLFVEVQQNEMLNLFV